MSNQAPFPYFGGKYRLLPTLKTYVPRGINSYVEPFFGSGVLFFSSPYWADNEVVNDLNGDVYTFFSVLRNQYKRLKHLIHYTDYNIRTFNQAKRIIKDGTASGLQRAWAFYVLMQLSIMANRRSFSRNSSMHEKSKPDIFRNMKSRLDYCADRLQSAVIENEEALHTCKRYDHSKTFIYLDPPYLDVKNKTSMEAAYGETVPSEKMHADLLQWCLTAKSHILISNYHNPLYDDLLRGWHVEEISVPVLAASGARGKKHEYHTAVEVLWSNEKCWQTKTRQLGLFNDGGF